MKTQSDQVSQRSSLFIINFEHVYYEIFLTQNFFCTNSLLHFFKKVGS